MATDRTPLFWFAVRDKEGRQWSVYLSCKEISPELTANEGIIWRSERVILINVVSPHYEQADTLLHELCHASLEDADLPDQTEEHVVASMTPPLLCMLQRITKLKWPKRPAGYHALARYARRRANQE